MKRISIGSYELTFEKNKATLYRNGKIIIALNGSSVSEDDFIEFLFDRKLLRTTMKNTDNSTLPY